MKKILKNKFFLSLLSALLLCLGWTHLGIGWVMFVAFVPILILLEDLQKSSNKTASSAFLGYTFLSFLIWNVFAVWWICNATVAGAILAMLMPAVLMAGVMVLVFVVFKRMGRRIGYMVFVAFWIAYEYLLMHNDLSWPWMILGNSFAFNIKLIQWYEYLGHFGGSLWILLANLLVYEIYRSYKLEKSKRIVIKYSASLACLIFVPMAFSMVKYYTYAEEHRPVDIVVIQPNIDPHNVKFVVPIDEQLDILVNLADSLADDKVDYFIGPETAIPNGMWENEMNGNKGVKFLRSFILQFPNANFIVGADTRVLYKQGEGKSETATKFGESDDYWDIFNSVLQIDTSSNIPVYHKSKLVSGVEMMPYEKFLGFFSDMMLNLGGVAGSRGTQDYREVFSNKQSDIVVGVPICYESDFAEFVTEFVAEGANVLFVITNDGWWGNTPGYKRHLAHSRLRAVETRRSIARSANTGTSCFINQRGDVLQELGWWQRGAIRQSINANNKLTFYVKYGDFIARMALVISATILIILLLHIVTKRLKRE